MSRLAPRRAGRCRIESCDPIAGAISERTYTEGLGAAGLEEIEIEARLVYDSAQIEALLRSEISGLENVPEIGGKTLAEVAQEITGKIWSAKFSARKRAD